MRAFACTELFTSQEQSLISASKYFIFLKKKSNRIHTVREQMIECHQNYRLTDHLYENNYSTSMTIRINNNFRYQLFQLVVIILCLLFVSTINFVYTKDLCWGCATQRFTDWGILQKVFQHHHHYNQIFAIR